MKFNWHRDRENTTEHHQYVELIRTTDTPAKARALGRQKSCRYGNTWRHIRKSTTMIGELIQKYKDAVCLHPYWYTGRDEVMLKAVREKFYQNPDLRKILISTGDAVLIEASPTDSYWGAGKDGKGVNKLGKILMQVRDELRDELRAS